MHGVLLWASVMLTAAVVSVLPVDVGFLFAAVAYFRSWSQGFRRQGTCWHRCVPTAWPTLTFVSSRRAVEQTTNVMSYIPLFGMLVRYLRDVMLYFQRIYFYVAGSA